MLLCIEICVYGVVNLGRKISNIKMRGVIINFFYNEIYQRCEVKKKRRCQYIMKDDESEEE